MHTYRNFRERVETLPQRQAKISQAFYFKEIPSTNLDVMSRGKLGAKAGTLIVADSQTQGRGRLERKWESPAAKGLYFSLLLRPNLKIELAPLINLAVGLGMARVLREWGLQDLQVKWPNDLMVDKKKLGGILTEMVSKKDKIDFIVLGVGLNVLTEPQEFSPETSAIATSLKQVLERNWDRGEVLEGVLTGLLNEVEAFLEKGPASLITRWETESGMVGKKVRACIGDVEVEGKVIGLAPNGELKIQTDQGKIQQLVAGDTTLI